MTRAFALIAFATSIAAIAAAVLACAAADPDGWAE